MAIPVLVIEDETSRPLQCLCGADVLYAWRVEHTRNTTQTECPLKACDECWYHWMWTQIGQVDDLYDMNCICNTSKISIDAVRTILTSDSFARISDKAALISSRRLPQWIACPSAECQYGHLHDLEVDGVKWFCQAEKCGAVACASCRTPWHDSETCNEYTNRTMPDLRSVRISEDKDDSISIKQCPRCDEGLYKAEGCDHITCKCGHEFCWECGCTYLHEGRIESLLLAHHTRTCLHYDPNIYDGLYFSPLSRREIGRMRLRLCFSDKDNARNIWIDFSSYLDTEKLEVVVDRM